MKRLLITFFLGIAVCLEASDEIVLSGFTSTETLGILEGEITNSSSKDVFFLFPQSIDFEVKTGEGWRLWPGHHDPSSEWRKIPSDSKQGLVVRTPPGIFEQNLPVRIVLKLLDPKTAEVISKIVSPALPTPKTGANQGRQAAVACGLTFG
jgi:hypothetical protein